MWAATRSAWTNLFERQLQYDYRSCLRNNVRKYLSRKSVSLRPEDPKPLDILISDTEFAQTERPQENPLEVKSRALAETLGCDEQKLKQILECYPDVIHKPLSRLLWSARILTMRYPVDAILKYPSVLNLSWRVLECRRRIYEEINARNRREMDALVLFDEIIGQTIFELSRRKIISIKALLPSILSKIENCPPSLAKELNHELAHAGCLALTLQEYRRIVIRAYLTNRLGKFTLPRYMLKLLERQSMDLISARMNILLNELRLDPQFLVAQSELLLVNTHNLQDILTRCEHLNDVPLREIVNGNPKVLGMSAKRLCDVEKILRSQSISPAFATNFPCIYNIHPDFFKVFDENGSANDEKLPIRWFHYKDIAERMSKIAQENRNRLKSEFNDEKIGWRSPWVSVMEYLAMRLGADASQKVEMRRALNGHPLKKFSNLAQCAESCDFLLNEGIMTKAQILRGVSICWWDQKTIRKAWEMFPKDAYEEALGPQWRDHPFLAEMLVYEMENFGISILPSWRVEEEPEEETPGELIRYDGDDLDDHNEQLEETSTDLEMSAGKRT